MAIIITKHGKRAKKIDKSGFIDEDNLQNFIYENPDKRLVVAQALDYEASLSIRLQ